MFASKKTSFVFLGLTAFILSKMLFSLFNDPEGANLLIVVGMAVFLYLISMLAYMFNTSPQRIKNVVIGLLLQVLAVLVLYICLK